MSKKRKLRPSVAEYKADVQRRMVEVLITVAPDAPVPRGLLEGIISTDSMLGGPSSSIADNVALAPSTLDLQVEGAEDLRQIATDMARGTFVVTAARQQRLRELFATLQLTSQAKQRRRNHFEGVRNWLIIEMYDAGSYLSGLPNDSYTPDQLALMVPHLLHLIDGALTEPDDDWIPAQALTTLWLLHDQGVVPERVVAEQTIALMAYCETHYQHWRELLPASLLIQAVEEMAKAKWEQAPAVGGRALEMAERILSDLPDEERGDYPHTIVELRQKLGLDGPPTA